MFKKIKSKGLKQFIIRLVVFLGVYLTISRGYGWFKELLNQKEITVNDGYLSFIIYFLIIIFIYARRDKIKEISAYKNNIIQTVLFSIGAVIMFVLPYTTIAQAVQLNETVLYFLFYGIGQFFIFLAVFNLDFFTKKFNEEILIILLILIMSAATPILIEIYWAYFFIPIKFGVETALSILPADVAIDTTGQGFKVQLGSFSGSVGPTCSGLFSMSTFTFLFVTSLVLLKRQNKISKLKTAIAYFSGIFILYLLNIFRIIVIMAVGAFYSQKLAIDLFHEYLSSIFLMGIFIFYLYKIIPRLTVGKKHTRNKKT